MAANLAVMISRRPEAEQIAKQKRETNPTAYPL